MSNATPADAIETTLKSLRAVRTKLYAIPQSNLNAMPIEQQKAYNDNLQQISTAILKLEAADLEQVNAQFKQRQDELADASTQLVKSTDQLTDSVKVIKAVSSGLTLVNNVVGLLG